jgi:hypothetical protein
MSPWKGMIVSIDLPKGVLVYQATALSGLEHILWNGSEVDFTRHDDTSSLTFELDGRMATLRIERLHDSRGRFSLVLVLDGQLEQIFDIRYRPFKRVLARKFAWAVGLAGAAAATYASGLIDGLTLFGVALLIAILPALGTRGEWSIVPRQLIE